MGFVMYHHCLADSCGQTCGSIQSGPEEGVCSGNCICVLDPHAPDYAAYQCVYDEGNDGNSHENWVHVCCKLIFSSFCMSW